MHSKLQNFIYFTDSKICIDISKVVYFKIEKNAYHEYANLIFVFPEDQFVKIDNHNDIEKFIIDYIFPKDG